MILAWTVAGLLVLATVMVHYEALRLLDWTIRRLEQIHRLRVVVVVLGCFCAHMVEVIVFGVALYLCAASLGLGVIAGVVGEGFRDYLYLSLVSYTSLGLGDIYPTGDLRFLIGVEALIGLMMITWSATFTFLEMKSLWDDHKENHFGKS
jgi:Ion channel